MSYLYQLGQGVQSDWNVEPLSQLNSLTSEFGGQVHTTETMNIRDDCIVIEASEDFGDRANTRLEPLGVAWLGTFPLSPPGPGTEPPG